ncbi:MAG TPA: fasciclin domain-containing protein [Burkholderiaceae bacterium]|nr:fasciclin domain-containing protein [Burkholderiaceae bacterium]
MHRIPVPGARALAASLMAATLAACGGGGDPAPSAVLGAAEANAGAGATASPTAPKSIVETAAGLPQFSSLVAALRFASEGDDLVRLLSGAGTFTVFAPTNDAFDALARELTRNPSATAADLLVPANKALVRAVLQYHVLGATVRKADVPLGAAIDPVLAGGDTFRIDASGDALVITDGRVRTARIVATDVTATNGVIHVLDKVILPAAPAADRTIVEIASGNENLSTLVEAVLFASENGDLATLLSGPGSFTVFAPTNAAFDALARELTGNAAATGRDLLVPANKALVRSVLQYHVLASEVFASAIQPGRAIEPALGGGAFFKIEVADGKPAIVDGSGRRAGIVATDIDPTNGVIHLLDRVILPADRSIVDIAASLPQFSSLVAAVQFASIDGDLVSLLSGPGTFTVFAPTNAAFDALARELTHDANATAAALLVPGNEALVRAVLQYHVLGARVLRAEVPAGQPIDPVLAGNATFTVNARGDALVITDARHRDATIAATDVFASNGVVHVLDRVILPPAH